MATLNYLCPTARSEVASGIGIDQATYDLIRLEIVSVKCPLCGGRHRFLVADGWIDDEGDFAAPSNDLSAAALQPSAAPAGSTEASLARC